MRIDKLTSKLQSALSDAQSIALGRDHNFIEPAHVLSALLEDPSGGIRPVRSLSSTFAQTSPPNFESSRLSPPTFARALWHDTQFFSKNGATAVRNSCKSVLCPGAIPQAKNPIARTLNLN